MYKSGKGAQYRMEGGDNNHIKWIYLVAHNRSINIERISQKVEYIKASTIPKKIIDVAPVPHVVR